MNPRTLVLGALCAGLVVTACKKKDSQQGAQSGFQPAQTGAQPQPGPTVATGGTGATTPDGGAPVCQPGQPCQPEPGQVPTLGAVLADPNAMQAIIAGALSGGAATLGMLTGGEMATLEQGIKMKAQTDAKGMKPEGQLMSAKLQQNGHAEAMVTLAPGSCYTIIGFAGLGVFQYQINVLTAPPLPPQVLAQSQATGSDPTVGPGDQCFRNPYPTALPVKIDMHLIKGQGLVGAQAYRK